MSDGAIRSPSPYTPGGLAHEVPGREWEIQTITDQLAITARYGRLADQVHVYRGPRGVGKTSLLRIAQRHATEQGFFTIWVTVNEQETLAHGLVAEINRVTSSWRRGAKALRAALGRTSFKVTAGFPGLFQTEVSKTATTTKPAAADALEEILRATIAAALAHRYAGLVVFIDEIQDADRHSLRTLANTWQHLQADRHTNPAMLIMSGLPASRAVLTEAATNTERYHHRVLPPISPTAVVSALNLPAVAQKVTWLPPALDRAVQLSGGYPHLIQLIGDATWKVAGEPGPGGALTLDHLQRATGLVSHAMEELFAGRWQKSTPAEKRFMTIMASMGDHPVERAHLADAIGISSDSLSVARDSLIEASIIVQPARGTLGFAIPGFAEYIRRISPLPSPDQRWSNLSETQQQYLHAMVTVANENGRSKTSEIAQTLGRPAKAVSKIRQRLLADGVLFSPARGTLMFTDPNLAGYIRQTHQPAAPASIPHPTRLDSLLAELRQISTVTPEVSADKTSIADFIRFLKAETSTPTNLSEPPEPELE